MKILIHAAAATAGGGVTYVKNVLPRLAQRGPQHQWYVVLPQQTAARLTTPPMPNLTVIAAPELDGLRRIWFDQAVVRRQLRADSFDLIMATGNFGVIRPPVPQVLLSRNALYFSDHHGRELLRRRLFRKWIDMRMKRMMALASIRSSVVNVTPTRAFQSQIERYGRIESASFRPVHHGFDHAGFNRGQPLAPAIAEQLPTDPSVQRLLFVSHYNYFRNFETVLRAVASLKRLERRPFCLILTTRLGVGLKEHAYDTTEAARLVESLGIEREVIMLGNVPHEQLAPLYDACDLAICPSYAETFGHPMVEAMACGLPVVATDSDVHREVCGDAALYFSVFDADDMASKLAQLLTDEPLRRRLSAAGRCRAADFDWDHHVDAMLDLIQQASNAPSPVAKPALEMPG